MPERVKLGVKVILSMCSFTVVIDYFVSNQPEIEECYNLAPVVKHLRNDADVLNAFFIDHEKEVENSNAV